MTAVLFPGQGSQQKGMGAELFPKYKQLTSECSEILGYSIEELCIENPEGKLRQTAFSQPAIFFINALRYLEQKESISSAQWFLGHSLGEINALFAAGAFDLSDGIKLVKKRGEIMEKCDEGGMAAILGLSKMQIIKELRDAEHEDIDIANENTPTQFVVSGPKKSIEQFVSYCDEKQIKAIPLYVSGAFHSRYMKKIETEFSNYLETFPFLPLKATVISNFTGKPYDSESVRTLLASQISNPVRWVDSINYVLESGCDRFVEIGAEILGKMVGEIREKLPQKQLGPQSFRENLGVQYNYVCGAMYRGISSAEMVIRMTKKGFLSFFGSGGLPLETIVKNIQKIQSEVGDLTFGVNFLCDYIDYENELKIAEVLVENKVTTIEASAFMNISPGLAYFAIKGMHRDAKGKVRNRHKIFGKVSNLDTAKQFLEPVPEKIVQKLLKEGKITKEEAELAQDLPISRFLTIEGDSGGHTDRKSLITLLPPALKLRDEMKSLYDDEIEFFVGGGGGMGTPEAIATLFMMGADYVQTGSINQCTVESGTSDRVKELLQEMTPSDTDYAPAGDMFEMGSKVQVLKKGTLFSVRANKLYHIYSLVRSIKDIPDYLKEIIEEKYFRKTFEEVFEETSRYFAYVVKSHEIERAEKDSKYKMALVFRWYLGLSNIWALEGDPERVIDYQIHTGPALGSLNLWLKGTDFTQWQDRHVDIIAELLMDSAYKIIQNRTKVVLA